MKHYPEEFWEQGSHGHAHRLLAEAALPPGLVLDLGCASGPLAEPVQALGHEYVGADVDRAAIGDLTERGFEGHEIDLQVPEDDQVASLQKIVGDRSLRCVLLLDVLEHLLDPASTLRAMGQLAQLHDGLQIVVSVPNVSHVDMGIKLLMGRWDLTDIGLLDDTHIRFFNGRLVARTMARTGWVESAASDVVNPFSDQLFPADAPALRPGTPLRQLLWRMRTAADPYGETYQFVRRYRFEPATAASQLEALDADDRPVVHGLDDTFLSVVVRAPGVDAPDGGDTLGRLMTDLAGQTDDDLELLVVADPANADGSGAVPEGLAGKARHLAPPTDTDWRDAAAAEARGRYVVVVDHRSRLSTNFVATVRQAAEALPGRVVQLGARTAPLADLGGVDVVDGQLDEFEKVAIDPLDLIGTGPLGSVALDAHAVPRQAWTTHGFGLMTGSGDTALAPFLLGAVEQCGIVRSDEPVVAVHRAALRDLASDAELVSKELGLHSMVIPEGAGSLLLAHRHALATVVPERDVLAHEVSTLRDQIKWLTDQLQDRDRRLAEHHQALTGVERLPEIRVRRKLGVIKRRLLGR